MLKISFLAAGKSSSKERHNDRAGQHLCNIWRKTLTIKIVFKPTQTLQLCTLSWKTHTQHVVTFWVPLRCRKCTPSTQTERNTPLPPWLIWPTQSNTKRRMWTTGLRWAWTWHYSWPLRTAYSDLRNYPEYKRETEVGRGSLKSLSSASPFQALCRMLQ